MGNPGRGGLSGSRIAAVVLGLSGAAACVIGSAMPWVRYSAQRSVFSVAVGLNVPFSGLNYPAESGSQLGHISLAAAAAAGVCLLIAQLPGGRGIAIASGVGGLVAGGAAWEFRQNPSFVNYALARTGFRTFGPGTNLVLIGSVAIVIASIITLISCRSRNAGGSAITSTSADRVRRSRRYRVPVPDLSPNWLPDPSKGHEFRFWDGHRWTERVADEDKEAIEPTLGASLDPY